ncbi:neurofilament light polypeptide [Eucyclogobius newberryi]|uniref:neurofilament light polypeptide n=1 Tax=Eucyclogobius newberryi TaxID=166745 RepID=UPI003B5B53CC
MSYNPYLSYRGSWDNSRGSRTKTPYSSSSPRVAPSGKRVLRLSSSRQDGPGMDLTQVSSANSELLEVRTQEREQLVGLNDRFATYVEKVRFLEHQNKALLSELEVLRARQSNPSRLHAIFEGEARSLRAMVESESGEKMRMEEDRDYLRDVFEQTKERFEEEARRRQGAEEELQQAREEATRALLSNWDAQATVGSLCDELLFLKKVFTEEQVELRSQLQVAKISVEVEVSRPDLSTALRDIRSQYERLANKNMQAAEEWYKNKFASVAEMATKNNEAVRAIREETMEYRRLLQSRSSEIEGLKNVIESLTKQLQELERMQTKEVARYQAKICHLEGDITDAKQEMARYLKDYQDLLNVKMALDIEIAAYRKLLEGEEIRLACPSLPALN